jgi:hypothetical protein
MVGVVIEARCWIRRGRTRTKLERFRDWLAEQQERVPRLRPGYEPPKP